MNLNEYTFEEKPVSIESIKDLGSSVIVPNKLPTLHGFPYKLAIVGEAPGVDEVANGQPFVGMSGKFLNQLLSKASVVRDAVFVGNVCQIRPPVNDITHFLRNGPEITSGLDCLSADLNAFNPNICLLLGKTALWAASGRDDIGNLRGSVFIGTRPGPFFGRKCVASYHPAACLRQYEWTPLLMFDIKKAYVESLRSDYAPPYRDLRINLTADEIVCELHKLKMARLPIATDIEGWVHSLTCISFAPSPEYSFVVPLTTPGGASYWSVEDEVRIWRSVSSVLEDPMVPKVWQNGLYDRFVLQYGYNICVQGSTDDTMLKWWELYCELEKSLGFQASILTNEPYYKGDRKSDDADTFWRYSARDSAVTFELNSKMDKIIEGSSRTHYQFNHDLINPLLYMELRGIKYDSDLAARRKDETNVHIYALQQKLDEFSKFGISADLDNVAILKLCRTIMCHKRNQDLPKKDYELTYPYWSKILTTTTVLTSAQRAALSIALDLSLNIKSKAFKVFLYDTLKLPKQYKINVKTKEKALTTDYEALLKIQKDKPIPFVQNAIEIGLLRTRAQMLEIHADEDGRIRCGYNIVGTETGRLSCYTSPTGSGYNLQTIPADDALKPLDHPLRKGMRDLFVADSGCTLFQCDLSGADGWTVAARLASLGDSTMLDDLQSGIKTAKVLCYLLRHGAASLSGKTRDEIKLLTKEVTKESWDYFACKVAQHMTCYMGGPQKLSNVIFMQSEGKVSLSTKEIKDLQNLVFIRYNVRLWWRWMEDHLRTKPELVTPSGHKRRFFGRYNEILSTALSHEPQAVTTYATNLAAYRLWTDSDNHININRLRVEPLHQVHDALLGQFKTEDTSWAITKIKSYFSNEIVIAGQPITIPFEMGIGPSWGNLTEVKL